MVHLFPEGLRADLFKGQRQTVKDLFLLRPALQRFRSIETLLDQRVEHGVSHQDAYSGAAPGPQEGLDLLSVGKHPAIAIPEAGGKAALIALDRVSLPVQERETGRARALTVKG